MGGVGLTEMLAQSRLLVANHWIYTLQEHLQEEIQGSTIGRRLPDQCKIAS